MQSVRRAPARPASLALGCSSRRRLRGALRAAPRVRPRERRRRAIAPGRVRRRGERSVDRSGGTLSPRAPSPRRPGRASTRSTARTRRSPRRARDRARRSASSPGRSTRARETRSPRSSEPRRSSTPRSSSTIAPRRRRKLPIGKDDARHAQHARRRRPPQGGRGGGLLAPPRASPTPQSRKEGRRRLGLFRRFGGARRRRRLPRPSHHCKRGAPLLRSSSRRRGSPELAALELTGGAPTRSRRTRRAARLRRAVAAPRAAERDVDARAASSPRPGDILSAAENETKIFIHGGKLRDRSTPLASWLLVHVACPELQRRRERSRTTLKGPFASGRRRSSGDASPSENGLYINPALEGYAVWGEHCGCPLRRLGFGRPRGRVRAARVPRGHRVARECLQTRDDEDRLSAAGRKRRRRLARAAAARFERGDSDARGVGRAGDARRLAHVAVLGPGVLDGAARRLRLGRERSYSRRLRRPAREGRRGGGVERVARRRP